MLTEITVATEKEGPTMGEVLEKQASTKQTAGERRTRPLYLQGIGEL